MWARTDSDRNPARFNIEDGSSGLGLGFRTFDTSRAAEPYAQNSITSQRYSLMRPAWVGSASACRGGAAWCGVERRGAVWCRVVQSGKIDWVRCLRTSNNCWFCSARFDRKALLTVRADRHSAQVAKHMWQSTCARKYTHTHTHTHTHKPTAAPKHARIHDTTHKRASSQARPPTAFIFSVTIGTKEPSNVDVPGKLPQHVNFKRHFKVLGRVLAERDHLEARRRQGGVRVDLAFTWRRATAAKCCCSTHERARTHAHTRTHERARTHAHTHTHQPFACAAMSPMCARALRFDCRMQWGAPNTLV